MVSIEALIAPTKIDREARPTYNTGSVQMRRFEETIFHEVNTTPFSLMDSPDPGAVVKSFKLMRQDNYDIVLEVRSKGYSHSEIGRSHRAGTIAVSQDIIRLSLEGYADCVLRNVIHLGRHGSVQRQHEDETLDRYSSYSVEIKFILADKTRYVVEWIDNLADYFMFNENLNYEEQESVVNSLVSGNYRLDMKLGASGSGGSTALHLNIDDISLFVVPSMSREDGKKRRGMIVYDGAFDLAVRDKIRNCLSFALGLPVVMRGYTEYDEDWRATFMKSIDPNTISGAVFALHPQHPYPINERRYKNIIDTERVNHTVRSLFALYDDIKFNEICWTYWHAKCSPAHTTAASFGAVLQQIQRNAKELFPSMNSRLIGVTNWEKLKRNLLRQIDGIDVGEAEMRILKNKISNLNQTPSDLMFNRFVGLLGLQLGDPEHAAWRERNKSAHGVLSQDYVSTILNGKILAIMCNRMIAAITKCSDGYVDYYNFEFPDRPLGESIPARQQ